MPWHLIELLRLPIKRVMTDQPGITNFRNARQNQITLRDQTYKIVQKRPTKKLETLITVTLGKSGTHPASFELSKQACMPTGACSGGLKSRFCPIRYDRLQGEREIDVTASHKRHQLSADFKSTSN